MNNLPSGPNKKYLVVITGPTAVGKTSVAIEIAKHFNTEIISADSRQFFQEMKIGTAMPTPEELSIVKHHLIGMLSISEPYNVFRFEYDSLKIINSLFDDLNIVIMAGGSGLYIDAVCNGIDEIPDPAPGLRHELNETFTKKGIVPLRDQLKLLDRETYENIDIANHKRIIRALEVCITSGKPFSSFLNKKNTVRPFNIIRIGLKRERSELNDIINRRVDSMINNGLEKEARDLYIYKDFNSLQTVGYKEFFDFFDGKCTFEKTIEKIKINSRRYAKKQMTWLSRDKNITWFQPSDIQKILDFITKQTHLRFD